MTFDERVDFNEHLRDIVFYLLIGLMSLLAGIILPFLGTTLGLEWRLPDTEAGWIVFIVSDSLLAFFNMLTFYCFMEQAKINVKDVEKYKLANEMLCRIKRIKKIKPRGPGKWQTGQYLFKGFTISIGTVVAAIGLSNAQLMFDLTVFISCIITEIIMLIFGYLQMRKAEAYWTSEYYEFAVMTLKNLEENNNGSNN